MVLKSGDNGPAVKTLQRGLNKLGVMLLVDGDFGAATRTAVGSARDQLGRPGPPDADDELQAAIAAVPDPCPPLTAAGVTFIAREEVSDARTYVQRFQSPICPPEASGVTIGIGYDCRFVDAAEFQADWGGVLPAAVLGQMIGVLGRPCTPALVAQVSTVTVTLAVAMRVFAERTLPKFLRQTRSIYPQIDGALLDAAQRTALVSLVYNRGTDLTGDRRREMKAIQGLLAAGQVGGVAAQFEAMTRLWDPATAGGLIRRRRAEATLWQSGFAALRLD